MAFKTNTSNAENPILYDMATLQANLHCGRFTAEKIAREAGARVSIGKRVLYDRKKIEKYLESVAE